MAKNMCFEKKAEVIHDILYTENGIDLNDVITAMVGLSKIVSDMQKEHGEIKAKFLKVGIDITTLETSSDRIANEVSKLKKRIHELKRGV